MELSNLIKHILKTIPMICVVSYPFYTTHTALAHELTERSEIGTSESIDCPDFEELYDDGTPRWVRRQINEEGTDLCVVYFNLEQEGISIFKPLNDDEGELTIFYYPPKQEVDNYTPKQEVDNYTPKQEVDKNRVSVLRKAGHPGVGRFEYLECIPTTIEERASLFRQADRYKKMLTNL